MEKRCDKDHRFHETLFGCHKTISRLYTHFLFYFVLISGEDIANMVAERLRLQAEMHENMEKQKLEEEELEQQRQEEQKKRWMALRGSPSKPSEQSSTTNQTASGERKTVGRGRGRGSVMANNLRRPGEKPSIPETSRQNMNYNGARPNVAGGVFNPPPGLGRSSGGVNALPGFGRFSGIGRGTKLHTAKPPEESEKYAASSSAPHPSEAPKPPRAWMS